MLARKWKQNIHLLLVLSQEFEQLMSKKLPSYQSSKEPKHEETLCVPYVVLVIIAVVVDWSLEHRLGHN